MLRSWRWRWSRGGVGVVEYLPLFDTPFLFLPCVFLGTKECIFWMFLSLRLYTFLLGQLSSFSSCLVSFGDAFFAWLMDFFLLGWLGLVGDDDVLGMKTWMDEGLFFICRVGPGLGDTNTFWVVVQ